MHCTACHTANADGHRFCEGCGAALALSCAACGHAVAAGARFCGGCGAALQAPAPVAPAWTARGEIKQATVLFADIVGSTELVAELDPEQAMERLRPALNVMCETVERFGGTVMSTLGDGVMALFGAPRAQEGHALLACEAALDLQRAFAKPGSIPIRIGLHSGAVVSETAQVRTPHDGYVHGVTAHVANRVQALAEPGAIYLTGDCYRLAQADLDVRALGRHALRGVSERLDVYELLGTRPAVASQRFRSAALTAFRGRAYELGSLRAALGLVQAGHAGVIGIAGAPGTGKSRLCFEFAEHCRGASVPVFEARAHPYGHAAPLQPVLEFLRTAFFKLAPHEPPDSARRRIAARLSGLGLEPDLPILFEFLGVPDGPVHLTAQARHERLLAFVRALMHRYGTRPWVMVVEDLHWLDEASAAFIAAMVDAAAGTRILLVFNYRTGFTAPWMRRAWFREITLSELPASDTDALVAELVGTRPELALLRRRVSERSGGNPFFAEELVRSLAEAGSARGGQDGLMVGRDTGFESLPTTVQAAIGARIDHLDDFERTIIQIGAIIGQDFTLSVLGQVADQPIGRLEAGLIHLCVAELLQPMPTQDGPRFVFRHPLIQEVAYATQLRSRRDQLHARVAAAMERHHADRLDEYAALMAHHYDLSGQHEMAARHMARAALWVGSKSPAQAIQHWRRVRDLLTRSRTAEQGGADRSLRIMASAQIAWLGWREGMTAEMAKPFIEEAVGWAQEADDSLVPLLLFVDARLMGASGGAADAYAAQVRHALALLHPGRDEGRAATLYAALSQAYGWAGLQMQALEANDAALARVGQLVQFDHEFLGYSVEHWTLSLRGRILGRLGRFIEAERCFASMLGGAFAQEDPTVRIIPHLGAIDAAWFRQDGPAASEHAGHIADLARAHSSPYLNAIAHRTAGIARDLRGDFSGAVESFTEARRLVSTIKAARESEAEILGGLADALLHLGRHGDAQRAAEETLELARSRTARMPECRATITLARVIMAGAGPGAEAARLLDRAEALIAETGAHIFAPLLGRAREALGRGNRA